MAPHGREMSESEKQTILHLHGMGLSGRKIAENLSISRSTIQKFLQRYNDVGDLENKHRSGRPKITSARSDTLLSRMVKRNRRQSLSDLLVEFNTSNANPVSKRTLKRRIHDLGYKRCAVGKRTTISCVNRARRIQWCRNHTRWGVESDWKKIIFTDETKIVLGKDRKVYVWRKSDEKWKPECLGVYGAHSPQSNIATMFWGCITHKGTGVIVPVEGNINSRKYINILDECLWPVVTKDFGNDPWILQEDNCPVHVSRETRGWKEDNQIQTLPWPAQSPDLNIIENIWRLLKIKLQNQLHRIKNADDLVRIVHEIWNVITPQYIEDLYQSIPRRIRAVIRAKGSITKY